MVRCSSFDGVGVGICYRCDGHVFVRYLGSGLLLVQLKVLKFYRPDTLIINIARSQYTQHEAKTRPV